MKTIRDSVLKADSDYRVTRIVMGGVVFSILLLILVVVIALAALIPLVDDQGADDYPGQKDLNKLTVDYALLPTSMDITWNWDDTAWSGKNTGDACALFDTDSDGFANYSLCVTVEGNPATLKNTTLYSCADDSSDRCYNSTPITGISSSCDASVVDESDPFGIESSPDYDPNHVSGNICKDNPGCYTADTVADCTVQMGDVGGAAKASLINVCSYPSQEPNSAPSECVVTPGNGFLIIKKVADPDDGTAFEFNLGEGQTSQDGTSSWTINGSGETGLISFAPETDYYDLSEVIPPEWELDSVSCAIQTDPVTLTGAPGTTGITNFTIKSGLETICTFDDTKYAHIIVDKVTDPVGDEQLFDFQASWLGDGTELYDFQLADGTEPYKSDDLDPGNYSVVETVPEGWDLESASCDDGSDQSSIDLSAGETVTCTFTNTRQQGSIELEKVWIGTAGETTLNIGTEAGISDVDHESVSGDDGTTGANLVDTGTYYVSETGGLDNYDSRLSCTTNDGEPYKPESNAVIVGSGDVVICTYFNTRDLGKIQLDKDFIGVAETVTIKITSESGLQIASDEVSEDGSTGEQYVDSGFYFVSEELTTPANYQVILECFDDVDDDDMINPIIDTNHSVNTVSGEVLINHNDDVICRFTNTEDFNATHGRIIVEKQTDPATDTTTEFEFDTSYYATNFKLVNGGSDNSSYLDLATYWVAEIPLVDWDTEISCDVTRTTGDGKLSTSTWAIDELDPQKVNINLDAGDTVTCTFTNENDAFIIVDKVTDPVGDEQLFDFLVSWLGDGSEEYDFQLADGTEPYKSDDLDPGTYSAEETVPEGWDLESASCDDGSDPSSIDLSAGETVTCTFTNTYKTGTIIIAKTAYYGRGMFEFEPSWGDNFFIGLVWDGDTVEHDWFILSAGTYWVKELDASSGSWVLTDLVCDDPSGGTTVSRRERTAWIDLAAGETVACTFTNSEPTRTQGFWSTHLDFTSSIFADKLGGSMEICGERNIDSIGELMGGFWADVSKQSDKEKRSDMNHARMQLIQQLLAAILNVQAFDIMDPVDPDGGLLIQNAKDAYCSGTREDVLSYVTKITNFNEGGDDTPLSEGIDPGPADPKAAKEIAEISFWDDWLLP